MTSGFEFETELCDALSSHLHRVLADNVRVVHELQVSDEIPDITLALPPELRAPRLSSLDSAVVAQLLGGQRRRANTIADRIFTQPERVIATLERLRRMNVVGEYSGVYSMTTDFFASARIIAIEAKLSRWRDALLQAVSYRRFSNQAYVALPMDVVHRRRSALRADCAKNKVGLLGVTREQMIIEVPAPSHEPRTSDWVLAVSRALSREISNASRTSETRSTNHAGAASLCAG